MPPVNLVKTMTVTPLKVPSPLRSDSDGILRVGDTRITLDTVIAAFDLGSTPEEIVQQFPSLSLKQVYATISTYLHHQSELQLYLEARRQQAQQHLQEIERQPHMQGIRQRLLARGKAAKS